MNQTIIHPVPFFKGKVRRKPGAIFLAIIAASIQNVPEPHVGSIKGLSGYQFDNRRIAAAIFSLIGLHLFSPITTFEEATTSGVNQDGGLIFEDRYFDLELCPIFHQGNTFWSGIMFCNFLTTAFSKWPER